MEENTSNDIYELFNVCWDIVDNEDYENPIFKKTFFEIFEQCTPVFISVMNDAKKVKNDIDNKNQFLKEILDSGDYDLYQKKKEEYKDLNGKYLDNDLAFLKNYLKWLNNLFNILNLTHSLFPQEQTIYSEKIYKFSSIIDEIEEVRYME